MYQVRESILEQLKSVPQEPGIYLMKDQYGKVIYVGKAKRLKNRLSSYFHSVDKHPNKTKNLVVNTAEFEYIIVSSEAEALLIEANFIKKHRPKFNVLLKDDKTYPFIKVTREDFPRLLKTRKVDDESLYFGPYTSAYSVNLVLEALHQEHPIRRCDVDLKSIKKECLYYHMNQCLGPCIKPSVKEEYQNHVGEILSFLKGDQRELKRSLEEKRDQASKQLNFELAITYRDQLNAIEDLKIYQKVSDAKGDDQDIIGHAYVTGRICITVFLRRDGKIVDRENHVFDNLIEKEASLIMEEFLLQYYDEASFIPPSVIVMELEKKNLITDHLTKVRGGKVNLLTPKRGEKLEMLELADKNALEYLAKFSRRIDEKKKELEEIKIILSSITSIDPIYRMEAYDISNIFGYLSVGSMVVYEDFQKKPSDYRKFKIKHVKGANDYHSMKEVLGRRLRRLSEEGFGKKPDLILVDGGKHQVGAALEIFNELGLSIPVMGMVKDDKHRTRGLFFEGQEIALEQGTSLHRFFYGVQEEVHRFAISYHRKLRGKSMAYSVLDEIEGIGDKRKQALLTHFGNIDGIMKASVESLMAIDGMNRRAAEAVYAYFH